ncbi:hypothetical protein [Paeniglutamicibacter terrestris]|uniref:Uncharacterized protein n=1 Tax=Paeniglutamicibacter terrestris TaxID=2723403 RepID=A0ABX1G4T7_9MICC|nr:hypothetical protein [Paeniglutamicibacter terrestris]NKG20585.1 hypothetical protein [Paeniglutamicibacter terrestris]
MSANEFTSSHDGSAHERLTREYVEALSEREIHEIIGRAERKAETIAHGLLVSGHPIDSSIQSSLIRSAILRELNTRAG